MITSLRTPLSLALALACLSCTVIGPAAPGDPGDPQEARVTVSTHTLGFGSGEDQRSITLTNTGAASVAWRAENSASWLAAAPASGTLAPGSSSVSVRVARAGLSPGTYSGLVRILVGDVALDVAVTAEVDARPIASLGPATIDVTADQASAQAELFNTGNSPLTWSLQGPGWITISPGSGIIAVGASQPITLTPDRSGLVPGTHQADLLLTSDGGNSSMAMRVVVGMQDPGGSLALSGQVVNQFSGSGFAALSVRYGSVTTSTDGGGRFTVAGSPTTAQRSLTISGAGIHTRTTFSRSTEGRWSVIPATFDMSAFDDVARDYEPRTIRWLKNPNIYIDTRHVGPGQGPQLATWIAEVRGAVEGFVADWSDGTVRAASVTVGTSPPPEDGPDYWIVIRFDDDPSHYASPNTVGNAGTSWSFGREILYSQIRFRFSLISGQANASQRLAVLGHELGHAMGMGHMDGSTPSMMTPRVSLASLSTFDARTGSIVYSRSPGNTSPDNDSAAFFVGSLAPAGRPAGENRWVCDAPAVFPTR